jgi:hypothetical protein
MIDVIVITSLVLIGIFTFIFKSRLSLTQYLFIKIVLGVIAFGYLLNPLPKIPYFIIAMILYFMYSLYKDYKEIKSLAN